VKKCTRRDFLKKAGLAAATIWAGRISLARGESPNEKLKIGVVGVRGRGHANLQDVSKENIVALCDIDDRNLEEAAKEFPLAKKFNDFRKLLDEKDVEAVVVSTPDHVHAPASLAALRSGRHVYCEKPLTHTVEEARLVAEAAEKAGVATQMGTQIHAEDNYRRVVELIESGAIGDVKEAHVWVGKAWSGAGDRPKDTPPVPPNIHYDLWLGPAPERPYNPAYIPASWRGWWDFGNGTLGDMACHHMDLSFWALKLRHPLTIEAEGPPVHPESAPGWIIVRYEFPRSGDLRTVRLTWYDGGKRPPQFAEKKLPEWGDGTLFVGDKGMLLADYGRYVLLPEADFAGFKPPAPWIPASVGHHEEWIRAAKTGSRTTCNFDYGGALTEAVLLGAVAYRTGKKLQWCPRELKARNAPEADRFIRKEYRKGWEIRP